MKKIIFISVLLFLFVSIGFSYRGDSLGSHKAKMNLSMQNYLIDTLRGINFDNSVRISTVTNVNSKEGVEWRGPFTIFSFKPDDFTGEIDKLDIYFDTTNDIASIRGWDGASIYGYVQFGQGSSYPNIRINGAGGSGSSDIQLWQTARGIEFSRGSGVVFRIQETTSTFHGDVSMDNNTIKHIGSSNFDIDWSGSQIYYVGKHGLDTNDGKSPNKPFLTFLKAVNIVKDQSPTVSNLFSIICYDAGIYTENLIISSYTKINAPSATINGTHQLGDCSIINIYKNEVLTSGVLFQKTEAGDCTFINCDMIIASGTASGVLCTSGDIVVNFRHIENYGTGWALASWTTDNLHARGEHIKVLGAGYGIGTAITAGAKVVANINFLEVTGTGGTGIDVANGTFVRANIIELSATGQVAYNIVAGGRLDLIANILSGSRINAGTEYVICASSSNIIQALQVNGKSDFNDGIKIYPRTTAQLKLITPEDNGEMYWNTDTESIYISTGTSEYAFIKVSGGITD